MLESLVANILNRTLGSYVENFDPNQLNIGIWSGDVTLSNLKLKSESLDKLELPLILNSGHLGTLTMQIPWSNLKSKPVKILIQDVYLLVSATLPNFNESNKDTQIEKDLRIKRQKLQDLEILSQNQSLDSIDPNDKLKNETFTDSLISKIIDNLQITIKNIHIRYEDKNCFTKLPYALGFTLDELSAVSTDENWIKNFIQNISNISRKLLLLKSLTIYLDTSINDNNNDKNKIFSNLNQEEMIENLKSYIDFASSEDSNINIEYLLQPVSGKGHLTLNKLGPTDLSPHYNIELFFEQFRLNLNRLQYCNILDSTSDMNYYKKTFKFRLNSPSCSISDDPYKWLQYSFQSVFNEIHERNYKKTWDYIKIRRDQRKEYIILWKKYLHDKNSLTLDEKKSLENLEIKCDFEDLKFYRSLAKLQYKKEFNFLPSSTTTTTTTTNNSGWFSSWWGSSNDTKQSIENTQNIDSNIEITDEQINEFYDAIEFDESKILADTLDVPKERVKIAVDCKLKKGSFIIKQNSKSSNLAEFISEGCHVEFLQRKDSYFIGFKLNNFSVEDGNINTLYKHIVSVKQLTSSSKSNSESESDSNLKSNLSIVSTDDFNQSIFLDDPFFQVSFENNPLDESADSKLIAKLSSITIFHNTKFIESIHKFFKPPKAHVDTIGTLMNAAESTIQDFTKQTKIGLQYAFEEHKTMNCKMDLQAPLIILPMDPTKWDSPVGILDAGHISINSDIIPSDKYQEIKNEKKDTYTEDDWKKMNTYMYDKLNLSIKDAQILIGPDIKSTIEQLHSDGDKNALVLDHLNMNFIIELSIIPKFYDLPRMKISGDVPRFVAMLSDYQYKIIMDLVNTIFPNFDDDLNDNNDNFSDVNTFLTDTNNNITNTLDYIDNLSTDSSNLNNNLSNSIISLSSPSASQHSIEFNFTMDLIILSIKRCSNTLTFESETLVDLVGDKLKLQFYKSDNEMHVDLFLADLSINDFMENSNVDEFKKLVGSKKKEDKSSSTKNDNLFVVNYTRSLRLANFKGEIIECYDQNIKLDISDFQVVITRKSILTLLNYSLNTFTDPLAPEIPSDKLRHNDETNINAPAHINVNINMKSINMILNDDGIKLATLILERADISVFMLPDSMRVSASLGGLNLIDNDTHNGRELITIQGDDLADLFYETYDPETNILPYSSKFKFETRSMVVMFAEDSFARIYSFICQFQRMKYIYDRARDVALDQANNVDYSNKMKFDILIRAPIFIFPKIVDPVNDLYDTITANLGEIHTFNDFEKKNDFYYNIIEAGLTNTKISSSFVVNGNEIQELEIIDKLDINVNIDYCDVEDLKRPSMIIKGNLAGNEIKLTEWQVFSIIQILQSFPRVFKDNNVDNDDIEDIENDATNANMLIMKTKSPVKELSSKPLLKIEEPTTTATTTTVNKETTNSTSIDLAFTIPILSLTLYNNTRHSVDVSDKKLSQFSLNDMAAKLQLYTNGDFKSDLHIKSFVVKDVRVNTNNVFTYIIPEVEHTEYQFMGLINSNDGETFIDVAIDSPRVILVMDYIFALKSFADFATHTPKFVVDQYMKDYNGIDETIENDRKIQSVNEEKEDDKTLSNPINYKINIVDPSITLLANSEKKDSEAVVFKISQLGLNISDVTNINASGIGMFLQKMSLDSSSKLRMLDDFSFNFNLDTRGSNKTSYLTTIDSNIDPLLLRLSLRDIYLAVEIFNRASSMFNEGSKEVADSGQHHLHTHNGTSITDQISKKISKYAPSIISSLSKMSQQSKGQKDLEAVVIVKGERLKINIQGFRLVLIGDIHELPILDFDVKAFEINAKNWSTELEADTSIISLVNIFNYSLSQWEPLLEPWSFAIHVEKSAKKKVSVNFVSRETAELTVTSRSIATLSHFANLLSEKGELKLRGEDSPYRIINQTGYDLNIWIDDNDDEQRQLTLLKDQSTIPWSFEDWRQVRESLSINPNLNYIGVQLLDSIYEPIRKLSLRAEGEEVMMLSPVLNNQYHNRIACEIILAEDKVKEVILKSTVTIKNFTATPIHVGVGNYDGEFVVDREIVIPTGEELALPIDYVYNGKLAVRPETTSEIFGWSTAKLQGSETPTTMSWESVRDQDLLLECPRIEENGVADYYYYKAHAIYNEKEALNQLYPHMSIYISPPLVIENLLPFDIEWRLFQKGPRKWNDNLKRGDKCPIHVVDMNYSAVMKIQVLGSSYSISAASIVNTPNNMTTVDKEINLKNDDGHRLTLQLYYLQDPKYGTKVSIYSPYIIVNRTGKDLFIMDNFNTLCSRNRECNLANNEEEYPDMFSFGLESDAFGIFKGNLEKNTVQLRIADSYPSESFSIDKLGQSFEVRVGLKSKNFENDVGIYITEGQGVYNLTKVIMIAPRYVIRNDLNIPIVISLVGSSKFIDIASNGASPIYEMPTYGDKQLMVGFNAGNENMSAAFVINNVGEIYIRVKKLNSNAHMLLRVVISTEHASIFINILDAKNLWPYSIRNFSDADFFIYQADPYIDKDGNRISDASFTPIFYKIPPKSVMPYAWDFPAAEVKELVLRCGSRERYIQLAEIGSLMPMRIKGDQGSSQIYDLNVIADGPVQALMISDYDPKTSMYQLKQNKSTSTALNNVPSKDEFDTIIKDEEYYTSVIFNFEGIGISLVNTKDIYQELCYLTIKGIEFHYNESDIYQTLSLKMKWLQIDNQLYTSIYPVILFPSIIPKSSYEMKRHPVFSSSIARLKDNTHGVNYIKFATILLQELSIQVDEDFLWALLDFSKIPGAAWNSEIKNELWDQNLQIPEPPTIRSTDDLYFEALHLQPLQFNISFVRTEHINMRDALTTQNALSLATDVLTMAIGNINDAPVRLSALFLENIRTPVPYLIQNISEHYKQAFLYQLYKVLGSADLLGNPVGLFNNISSGVMDMFYEPYQGYIMTDRPQELGIGLAKGSISFMKKSVFGVSDSVSRFTNSMAKGLTAASLDKDFQEKRRLARQYGKPSHPVDSLSIGATSFINGISSGLTGLATAPMEGATREGTSGFFKGLGKGLLGLPTKTATGVLDLANNISESIKSTTTVFDGEGIEKVRLPRFIPHDGAIVTYSKKEAQGQSWLKSCGSGMYSEDQYLAHIVLQGGDRACIISFNRILVVRVFDLGVDWQIPLDSIQNITLEKTGIRIKTKNVVEPPRFIPLPDKADKRYLYTQIATAVNEYNKHCIVAL
ncbi:hypothetical protein C6P40_000285 [Pichia californica]|uniref:Vacuolar protein sorting-associated protein n=1 Tax=Pichia californica TaxID=460514 RepID=A0A9P7BH89_9ASCO|nr:hypothetical protein C6P42_002693 [[Candida] californica]KAG0691006.1 hypothetical protein C6P40_000285 [[Candida] californica]